MTSNGVLRRCARFVLGCFLFGAMIAGFHTEVFAQAFRVPFSFDKYTNGKLGPRPIMTRRDWWVVWADRANVPVYRDRQGNQRDPSRVLSFREELVVLDEEETSEMLLLGKTDTPPSDPREPVITETVGWVKWDHLILSYAPIKDRDTLISKKAFIINDWRRFEGKKSIEEFKELMVDVRAAPSDDAPVLETITGVGQRFSYVYKYDSWDNPEPEWYLVGKQRTIYYGRAEDNIVGWIPARRAQPWDTRQALEPDPNRESPANVYLRRSEVADPSAEPLFIDTMRRDPWPPDKWRYAVLVYEPGRAGIQIGWLGSLAIAGYEEVRSDTSLAGIAAEAYRTMKNVNIIFVMDATKSMGPYLDAVSDAITNVMNASVRRPYHSDMNRRFGAVVYRDLKDIPGERIDIHELTSEHSSVARFLKNAREPSTEKDPDFKEALFKGIEDAIANVAAPGQTNILIVVGDAGNNDQDYGLSAALRTAIEKEGPPFIALHLRRPPRPGGEEQKAIAKFEPDMERVFDIVKKGQEELYDLFSDIWPKVGGVGMMPKAQATNLFHTGENQEDILGAQQQVESALDNILKVNGKMMNAFSRIISGDLPDGVPSSPEEAFGDPPSDYMVAALVLKVLMEQVEGNREEFELALRAKVQIFERGWVRMTDDQGRQLMRPVQLVSRADLAETERALNRLFVPGRTPDRVNLKEAWEEVTAVIVGEKPQNAKEYFYMVGGILFREESPILSLDYDEIMDMPDDEFQELLSYISDARERVSALKDREGIWFFNYDDEYAWIPIEDMP